MLLQVSQDGVVHLSFHPGTDRLLLAAGDKGGNVSIWNIDHTPSSSTGQSLNGPCLPAASGHCKALFMLCACSRDV